MAGVVAGKGDLATAPATGAVVVAAAAQSAEVCAPVGISSVADSAVAVAGSTSGRKPGRDLVDPSSSAVVNGSGSARKGTSTSTSPTSVSDLKDPSSPAGGTQCEDPSLSLAHRDRPGKVWDRSKVALSNGHVSKSAGSDPVSKHGEGLSCLSRSCVLPPAVVPFLPKVVDLPESAENVSETSVGSSSTSSSTSTAAAVAAAATLSTFFLPLPPVPSDMAEAIKRQQKGAGSVRYWKTKHLQSGRNNQPLPLNKPDQGGVQNGLFPVLKPPALHGPGTGVPVANGNTAASPGAGSRLSRAKERLIRQKGGKEQGLVDFRRSLSNAHAGQPPAYHTQYMYGHSLGDYPPPPPAYRRSVTALASLLSLPLPSHPQTHKLTPASPPSNNPQLTDVSRPNNAAQLTLTHLPSQQRTGRSPPPNSSDGVVVQEVDLLRRQAGELGEGDPRDQAVPGTAAVAELTCLQLADAILSAKAADLSQYYQICQTKIRYVDFLERSAAFRAQDSGGPASKPFLHPHHHHHHPATTKTQPASLLHHHPHPHLSPRLHTWVPSLDLKDPEIIPDDVASSKSSPRRLEEVNMGSKERRTPVGLPSLGTSLSHPSHGLRMSHGVLPTSVKGFLSSAAAFGGDSEMSSAAAATAAAPATSSSSVAVPMPTGKPILKPFNPDAIPVKIHRPYDPFSPRSIYSDLTGTAACPTPLSVRGTTMYPLGGASSSSEEGHRCVVARPGEGSARRSQSSKSRKEAEMRKRAVRFSISDQVYEFAPGEPLVP